MNEGLNTIFYYFLIALGVTMLSNCKDNLENYSKLPDKSDRTLVMVEPVKVSNSPIPIHSIGKVGAEEQIKLSFKIGGIVAFIDAEIGQMVRKGEVLAKLRTNEIDAQVLKAERALQKAERDLERISKMYKEGAATLENVQDLTTLVDVSRQDVKVAKFNQTYAVIKSPVRGRVTFKNTEVEELVGPGQPIIVISSDESSSLLKASISDKDVSKVNCGDKSKIYFDAYPNEVFDGKVLRISESADPRSGTFEVEIKISQKGKRLRNGYIGRVEILPKQVQSYYKIPIRSIVEGTERGIIIFTPENGVAKKHTVYPEYIGKDYFTISRSSSVEIKEVITTGAPYLYEGSKIQIKN